MCDMLGAADDDTSAVAADGISESAADGASEPAVDNTGGRPVDASLCTRTVAFWGMVAYQKLLKQKKEPCNTEERRK